MTEATRLPPVNQPTSMRPFLLPSSQFQDAGHTFSSWREVTPPALLWISCLYISSQPDSNPSIPFVPNFLNFTLFPWTLSLVIKTKQTPPINKQTNKLHTKNQKSFPHTTFQLLFHLPSLDSNICNRFVVVPEELPFRIIVSSSFTIQTPPVICFLALLVHEVALANVMRNTFTAKANTHLSDLIWVTFVVTDHSLLKPSSLVSKTMETPGFLFKSWEVLLILSYRFLFLCLYFGCGCSPSILTLAVFSFAHLGELSLILTPGESPDCNYMYAKNIYLYLYYFQTPTAYWTFSTLISQRPETAYPSLKFSVLQPSLYSLSRF